MWDGCVVGIILLVRGSFLIHTMARLLMGGAADDNNYSIMWCSGTAMNLEIAKFVGYSSSSYVAEVRCKMR